jgi:hypothetical protein
MPLLVTLYLPLINRRPTCLIFYQRVGSLHSFTFFSIKEFFSQRTYEKAGIVFLICYRSRNMRSIERVLQRCLNSIQTWADENGFQFSKTKTVCMHFCRQCTLHPDPELKLCGATIPVADEVKFLGLIFDRKLTFAPHTHYLKQRCLKALNLLRVVAHTDWVPTALHC